MWKVFQTHLWIMKLRYFKMIFFRLNLIFVFVATHLVIYDFDDDIECSLVLCSILSGPISKQHCITMFFGDQYTWSTVCTYDTETQRKPWEWGFSKDGYLGTIDHILRLSVNNSLFSVPDLNKKCKDECEVLLIQCLADCPENEYDCLRNCLRDETECVSG